MSQETKNYQYERNDFNTYGVRGSASGGGTDVEANPEGTATADLEKLKVGETIYDIPDGNYPINTYQQNKTYTNADTNYEQLRDDIINHRPIAILLDGVTSVFHLSSIYNTYYAYEYIENPDNVSQIMKRFVVTLNENNVVLTSVTSSTNYVFLGMAGTNFSDTLLTQVNDRGIAKSFVANYNRYLTTAPTADNTSGYLQTVVLTSEPATYYNGYYYIIAPTP